MVGQPFQDQNPDHFAAALILAKAWAMAKKRAEVGPYWLPVASPNRGFEFPPLVANEIVDVTGHEETALNAMACHRSQGGHLSEVQQELKKAWQGWGEVKGCPSAEGFCVLSDAPD